MQHRALFLDRDGLININHGYVYLPEHFEFIDGIFELARVAHTHHCKFVVITNQAGIAREFYSEQQFHDLTTWMCDQFAAHGAPITKVYSSPYHPTSGFGEYKKDDISRKPHPGIILKAKSDLSPNLKSSTLIGDKPSDIQAGIAAGVGCNLLIATGLAGLSGKAYRRISALGDAISYFTSGDPQMAAQ